MIILQKDQNINFKYLRCDVAFLLALKMMGRVSPHHFLRVDNVVEKQTSVPSCQFNEESIFYLTHRMLECWCEWGIMVVLRHLWLPFKLGP